MHRAGISTSYGKNTGGCRFSEGGVRPSISTEPEEIGIPPITFRRDPEQPFETPAEVIGVDIAAPPGNFRHRFPGGEQQFCGLAQLELLQVSLGEHPGVPQKVAPELIHA